MICMNLEVLEARGLARPRAAELGLLCVLYYVTRPIRVRVKVQAEVCIVIINVGLSRELHATTYNIEHVSM